MTTPAPARRLRRRWRQADGKSPAPAISVLCPTRNRPDSVVRMMRSALRTAAGPVEFVFYTDDDAEGSVPADIAARPDVTAVTGPRITMTDMWNRCMENASADIFMQGADDITFNTPGWDMAVVTVFALVPDKIVLVYGDDLIQGAALGTHSFLHRRWVETVGYFTPPYFSRDYGDTWINEMAARLNRRCYLPHVITEHHHLVAGKAPLDETHRDRLARGDRDRVDEIWARTQDERIQDTEKLRLALNRA
jgi:hypothetical protein